MAAAELELDRLEMSEIKTIGEKARVEKTSLLISDRPEKDDDRSRERELEELLYSSGYGFFHVLLILVTGLATAADAVEIFGVSFVVPIAEKDLDLTTATKGYLDASIFIGMLIGSYLWGSLADVFGRKKTLITAMVINGVCGFTSAFSPNFYVFIIFRFASGIGVGGSQPIVFSYISEFFSEKQRGPIIIMLASCWQPGIIFTAFLAWGMLGIEGAYDGISFYIGSLHFVNWRLFIIICTFPAFLSSISLFFMTETPAFLFHTGKNQEFNKVLKKILKVNSLCLCCWCVKPTTDTVPLLSSQEDGLNEDPSVSPNSESGIINPPPNEGCCTRLNYFIFSKFMKIILTTAKIFKLNYIRATSLLLIIWFTQSFGYYGLQLWFPEYFKRLSGCDPEVPSLEINFSNCSNGTNLQYYQDTLYTAIASLPGNVAGAVLINIIGGRIQLVAAMFLSALSVFLIWGVPNVHSAVVGVSCIFSAVTVTVFGSLDVINMNIYDISARSTAFGVHSGIGRIGAILGNVMFGHLLDVSKAIPILIVASFLAIGAVSGVFLPPIYRQENHPPLLKCIAKFKRWFCSQFHRHQ